MDRPVMQKHTLPIQLSEVCVFTMQGGIMKKALVLAVVLSGFIFLSSGYAAEQKFGYIDITKVFSEYSKTKAYDKVFKDKQDSYEASREKMVSEIKQYQDKINLLSEKEKDAKKSDLEGKIKNLQDFDRQNQTDLRKEQEEKLKELLKDIEEVIKQYCAKENYTFVFHDKALAYYDKNLEITDKIVELVNKGTPAAVPVKGKK
jgi:outer membrane protein